MIRLAETISRNLVQGVCRWSIDMIISVAIKTAGPQLAKAANQSSGLRKMLLSSCMAPSSTKADC